VSIGYLLAVGPLLHAYARTLAADSEARVETPNIANVEMAQAWDGHEGDDWTENATRYEESSRWVWARFEEDVPVARTDDVLDVGCGTGRSTLLTARRAVEGTALGVDLSARMLGYARERAAEVGITNVTFFRPTRRSSRSHR
jgi:SAM-dependent methyltransferase